MNDNILVIGGGQSPEHEVSLASAAAVATALRSRGFVVTAVTIARDGTWMREGVALADGVAGSLAAAIDLIGRADAVFPALHGALGEDGALAALCALAHTPVVGSGLAAGAIAMNKWATKLVAEAAGLRVAPGILIDCADIEDAEFDESVVVKPVSAGSSFGVTLVQEAEQLVPALRGAAAFGDRILVERVVRGREIDVAVLREAGGTVWASPALEIQTDGLFDTATKYDGSARFVVPAVLSEGDRRALTSAAVTMFEALGCAGVARMDFFLTDDGPVLNEVNTMPGMTASSQVPRMFQAAGVAYPELVSRLVQAAITASIVGAAPKVAVG